MFNPNFTGISVPDNQTGEPTFPKSSQAAGVTNVWDREQAVFHSITEAPFAVSGFGWQETDGGFCRLPKSLLPQLSNILQELAYNTSGGMARFKSDTPVLHIRIKTQFPNNPIGGMTGCATSGVDVYTGTGTDKQFAGGVFPYHGEQVFYGAFVNPNGADMTEWTINFPLANGIQEMEIGVVDGFQLAAPNAFTVQDPIVFYGSSITHGIGASRPGMAYPQQVCRRLDANLINLGFSGNAKGEEEMAQAIAGLKMSAFVLDYDHNAPDTAHLLQTHQKFYQIIREKNPELPILILSRPDFHSDRSFDAAQREVVKMTYDNAVRGGDKNVYFIDGEEFFGSTHRMEYTIDGCHPNDLGYFAMTERIYPVLAKVLGLQE